MNKTCVFNTYVLLVLSAFLFFGCTKEDDTDYQEETDEEEQIDPFYEDAITTAKSSDILGYWAFFEVEFEGRKTEVPVNYENCDRDYFNFSADDIFSEYVITDSGCSITELKAKWSLEKGVISINSLTADSQEMVIVAQNKNEFTVKTQLDYDDDGVLDIFALTAKRYEPKDRDMATDSFALVEEYPINEKIQFAWQAYSGQNSFSRYEIYRSPLGCDKANAILIATINDIDNTEYFDAAPPITEQLCYFLRIYTDKGLAGESYMQSISPESLGVLPVELETPMVTENSIQLNWAASENPYFSHYEIYVQNHDGGFGGGYQQILLATIENQDTTTYVDNDLPYFMNPVYSIKVYNQFGNANYDYHQSIRSVRTANFKRPEVLELNNVLSAAIDPESSAVYFFGEHVNGNGYAIQKLDYETKIIEATSQNPNTGYIPAALQAINSGNGTEIILPQYDGLHVYDAINLTYKYNLALENSYNTEDFAYLGNSQWAVVDRDNLFIYRREYGVFELISKDAHYTEPDSYGIGHQIIMLSDNRILVTRNGAEKSILFKLDAQGKLANKSEIALSLHFENRIKPKYIVSRNHIIDFGTNRIYNGTDFRLVQSFEAPYYATGCSKDGAKIYGSNNDPEWSIQEGSLHEKKMYQYNVDSRNTSEESTIGYPLRLFEDYQGRTISLSSGLKRRDLQTSNPKPDLFVEIVGQ